MNSFFIFCSSIQELDNGFFERFGDLLKDHNEHEIAKDHAEDVGNARPADAEEEPVEIEGEGTREIISDVVGLNVSATKS